MSVELLEQPSPRVMTLKGRYYHSLLPHDHSKRKMKAGREAVWHQRVALPPPCCNPPFPHHTGTLHLSLESCTGSQGAMGALKHTSSCGRFTIHTTFSSAFHHKLRVQILLSCSPAVVHSNTTLSILWWETSSPEPTVPLGNTKGRPRTGETGCWDSTGLVQKEKWRPNRSSLCFSKMNDWRLQGLLQLSEQPVVAGECPSAAELCHCHPAGQEEQIETPIAPTGPNLTGKAALTFLVSPG